MNKHLIFLSLSIIIHITLFALVSMSLTDKKVYKQKSSFFSISLINPQIVQEQVNKQEKSLKPLDMPKKKQIMNKEKTINKQEYIIEKNIIKKKDEAPQPIEKDLEKPHGMLVENLELNINEINKVVNKENISIQEDAKTEQTDAEKYLDLHLEEIRKLINENTYYPRSARLRGLEGEIIVSFCIKKDGLVKDIKVINKNNETLSNAAMKTIKRIRFPKPEIEIEINVPIVYKLNN